MVTKIIFKLLLYISSLPNITQTPLFRGRRPTDAAWCGTNRFLAERSATGKLAETDYDNLSF